MNTARQDERSEIEELLPWHAAGTLGSRDAQRVEAALQRDPELARHYQLVREELAQTIHLNETLGAPSARAMETLFARIDAEPQRRAGVLPRLTAHIAAFFAARSPRTLAYAGVAAAVAIMLQAAFIADLVIKQTPGNYETASVANNSSAKGSYALIRFQPQASVDEINKFLAGNKLSIVAGPAAGSLYRVRIAETRLPKPDLAPIIKSLQGDRVVAFIAVTE